MRRTVTIAVGGFGLESLGGSSTQDPENLARPLVQAIRYYLADQESGRAGWLYPGFRRDDQLEPTVEVQVEIDDTTWETFSAEAGRQEVSTDRLASHAVLYFAADRDGGRIAQRLAEGLGSRGP